MATSLGSLVAYRPRAARCVAILVMALMSVYSARLHGQALRTVDARYREVLMKLTEAPTFPGGTVISVTFGILGDEREMNIAFDPTMSNECAVLVRYVPGGRDSVYQRLFALMKKTPDVSVETAARSLALTEEERAIPCDGHLAGLLRQGAGVSVPLAYAAPERTVFIHGLTYRVESRTPDARMHAELPSAADIPIVKWLNLVRAEVRSVMGDQE